MYKFNQCSKEEINKFNNEQSKGHIFQTSLWCDFKSEWNQYYFSGKNDKDETVLTCSLLVRKVPYLNKYIGYIPRGFVCDYCNITLLREFREYLKSFSKSKGISFITIDPDIHLKENTELQKSGEDIKQNLIKAGFVFANTDGKNFEAIQPKFSFRLDISNPDNLPLEKVKENVFNKFHKKWRYNIKLSAQRCIEVEWYDKTNVTDELLEEFQSIMDITGQRDGFLVRKKSYFENLIHNVNPGSRLYMVKYNIKKDRENSKKKLDELKKEQQQLEAKISDFIHRLKTEDEASIGEKQLKAHLKDTKKADSLKEQILKLQDRVFALEEYDKDYIYLSGAIYLFYGNKAWYLYGASKNDFRDTMPNFAMQWSMIQDSIDMGIDIYDFRGVSGDLDESNPLYGLYKFKKGFNGDFVEFIGEGDLIINKGVYKLFKDFFPKYKKLRAKVHRVKHK